MLSGSTALTVAFVPTATKAGVLSNPWGVVITPERPRPFGNDAPGTKPYRPSTGCCGVNSSKLELSPSTHSGRVAGASGRTADGSGRIAERSGRTDRLPP